MASSRWAIAPRIGSEQQRLLGVDSLLLAQLLWNRGVRTRAAASAFLGPDRLSALADPWTMRGMPEAVACLETALSAEAPIAVYGDYDVDGIAGAALLVEALRAVGAQVLLHVPHRERDGYGLKEAALRALADQGAGLVVTVDCGISADQEVAAAAALGLQVVVTDHHTIPARLPTAAAVLNPHHPDCRYPCKELAGGGVAFQLARAVLERLLPPEQAEAETLRLTDLAALSTVADVVPLVDENRSIVTLGLGAIREGWRPGLRMLAEVAGKRPAELTARDLAFALIPRLNAAGRLGEARDAVELLLARDESTAEQLAAQLDATNSARRQLMDDLLGPVLGEAGEFAAEGAAVVDGPYPIGLAGLLASRVVDQLGLPCAVIQRSDRVCRGSARAPDGANLMELLAACSDTLLQYGGHPRAAGFSLPPESIEAFRQRFAAAARAQAGPTGWPQPVLTVDAALRLQSIGPPLADLVERFEPTGEGNRPPLFVSRGTVVSVQSEPESVTRVRLRDGAAVRRAVLFGRLTPPEAGARVEVAYEVRRSVWQGDQQVDLIVRDLQPAPPGDPV